MSRSLTYSFDELFTNNLDLFEPKTLIRTNERNLNYEIDYIDEGFVVYHDAPGYKKDEINVSLENGILEISGKRTYTINKKEKTKQFNTKIKLNFNRSHDDIKARLSEGVLSVFVPKLETKEKTKIRVL